MIYTEKTKVAAWIMYNAHGTQDDKAGFPYILHPIHLAEQMDDESSTIVALLHDVVEDTEWDMDMIRKEAQEKCGGFPEEVFEALGLLTHNDGSPYMEYVESLSSNPIARKVKLADLENNMDTSRIKELGPDDLKRLEKYSKAKEFLMGV